VDLREIRLSSTNKKREKTVFMHGARAAARGMLNQITIGSINVGGSMETRGPINVRTDSEFLSTRKPIPVRIAGVYSQLALWTSITFEERRNIM
jgi:hypothetical protein